MKFAEYENGGKALYTDFAGAVAAILNAAIVEHNDLRLQNIQHRAKAVESLRAKLVRAEASADAEIAKNLFLRDARGKRHFLVVLCSCKAVDLKALRGQLGTSALSFASEDRLKRFLGLEKGAVTPLGILNDEARAVEVLFDRDLAGLPSLGVHPNRNTATVFLAFSDLESLIRSHGNCVSFVAI